MTATTTTPDSVASDPPQQPQRRWTVRRRNDLAAYLAAILGSCAAMFVTMRLWLADLSIPLAYSGDAVSSAAHVKATMQWGWYENQIDLGAPYGQRYHDYPFGDNLPLIFAKVAGWFTDSWPLVFNLYYLLGFPLAAVTALWFLRRCRVSRPIGVGLAVLFAVAPYHWLRGESHYYLSGYWAIPIGIWVALAVLRGRPIWGARRVREGSSPARKATAWLTGSGALVAVGLTVLATSAAYYAVFATILIGFSGLVALVRTHSWRRFIGAAAAGGLLVAVVVLNVLPDVLYQRSTEANPTGFFRAPADSEYWALKVTSLVLPAPGHQIPVLAEIRNLYDSHFPLPSEQPALGLFGAGGLMMALGIAFYAVTRALQPAARDRVAPGSLSARGSMLLALSGLTLLMILLSTVGGLGTMLSFLSPSLRGWNRMSIFIALTSLAVGGLVVDLLIGRFAARARKARWFVIPRVALALFIGGFGVFDQAIAVALPLYDQVRTTWQSDAQFVRDVEATAGADAKLFQAPSLSFPETPIQHNALDSDVVKLSLHSTTLRWSGGGIKGRPQTDWPMVVNELPADQIVLAVAAMGFDGIVVDVNATPDKGAALMGELAAVLGDPTVNAADGRWHYYSLTAQVEQVAAVTTPEQRAAFVRLMLADARTAVTQILR